VTGTTTGGGAAASEIDVLDVALVGMRKPRFVELNNEISEDVASRIDLAKLHDWYGR